MFEAMTRRVGLVAERRARTRAVQLAERVEANVPPGVIIEAVPEGVRLSGRGLRRRFALEPALRWLTAGLR